MDKAIKKEAYTHAGKLTVDASDRGERKAVLSTSHSITQKKAFVKQNSAVLCGNLLSDDDWNRWWERYIFMGKFKRGVVCALIAICATGFVLSVCTIIKMFMVV